MNSQRWQITLGLSLVVVVAITSVWFAVVFWQGFMVADKAIQASIIAAFVGIFTVAFTYWKERSRSIKEAHRDKKIEVYSQFYDMMFSLLRKTKSDEDLNNLDADASLQEQWFSISRGVVFYGAPNVVKAFSDFKSGNAVGTIPIMRAVGKVLLAMRSDIGLSNFGLDELTIHQIYLKDDVNKLGLTHEHS